MWLICVEVEQETSAPPPKKHPGSAPVIELLVWLLNCMIVIELTKKLFYKIHFFKSCVLIKKDSDKFRDRITNDS